MSWDYKKYIDDTGSDDSYRVAIHLNYNNIRNEYIYRNGYAGDDCPFHYQMNELYRFDRLHPLLDRIRSLPLPIQLISNDPAEIEKRVIEQAKVFNGIHLKYCFILNDFAKFNLSTFEGRNSYGKAVEHAIGVQMKEDGLTWKPSSLEEDMKECFDARGDFDLMYDAKATHNIVVLQYHEKDIKAKMGYMSPAGPWRNESVANRIVILDPKRDVKYTIFSTQEYLNRPFLDEKNATQIKDVINRRDKLEPIKRRDAINLLRQSRDEIRSLLKPGFTIKTDEDPDEDMKLKIICNDPVALRQKRTQSYVSFDVDDAVKFPVFVKNMP